MDYLEASPERDPRRAVSSVVETFAVMEYLSDSTINLCCTTTRHEHRIDAEDLPVNK